MRYIPRNKSGCAILLLMLLLGACVAIGCAPGPPSTGLLETEVVETSSDG